MKAPDTDSIEATAFHEAGHVVVGVLLGLDVHAATVIADEHTLGQTSWTPPSEQFRPDREIVDATRNEIEARVMAKFAGGLAEERFAGAPNDEGAAWDREGIVDLAGYMVSTQDELEAYITWLRVRTSNMLANPIVWQRVEALAAALVTQGRLDDKQIAAIVRPPLLASP